MYFILKHAVLFVVPSFQSHCAYITICVVFLSETNECDPNPCINNGKCIDGVQNYTCNCTSLLEDGVLNFYTGRNCAESEGGWVITA